MTDKNSSNKNRNITGSYPGVTGSYKRASEKPAQQTPAPKPKKSEVLKKPQQKKESFDWKLWFSQENVKGFMLQLRFYGIIVLISLLFTIGIVNVSNDVFAFIKPDESIIVSVAQGSPTETIAKSLKKEGVIDHPFVFRLYCKLKKADGKFQYGDYTLNSNYSYDQIISSLKKTSVQAEKVKVTIPEGSIQDDITEILTAGKYTNITDLDHALNSYEYENFEFTHNLPERRCRLEGYLPAGEYELSKGESAVSIVSKMLERFKETMLTEENLVLIDKTGKSLDDIIITASLVQAECDSKAHYKEAASVLANRLSNAENNYLQLTSPINYVLAKKKATLTANDKLTSSEYNTYIYAGLPTGPVCTPSVEALDSVINPQSSAYMYFVSDGEKTLFATTADEHAKNLKDCSESAKGTDVIR